MLRLYEQGPHAHILKLPDGTEILFSYETPVAGFAILPYSETRKFFKSADFFSKSTSMHISKYLRSNSASFSPQVVDQHIIEALALASSDVLTLTPAAIRLWNKENPRNQGGAQ